MHPRVLSSLFAVVLCLTATPALAQEPSRFSFGLRTGFGLPGGVVAGGDGHRAVRMKEGVDGILPLQLDLGLFVSSNVYMGASFQYAYVLLATGCSSNPSVACSSANVRLGLTASYHLPVSQTLSPWLGVGTGVELFRPGSHTFTGYEFFNVQAGTDFHIGGSYWLGPFATFAMGEYANVNDPEPHYWLIGGVRLLMRPGLTTR